MSISLRSATPSDIPHVLALVRDLAEYEGSPNEAKATPELMQRAMFGDPKIDGRGAGMVEGVIGYIDNEVQGLALYFMNFSSWTGKPGMYLEDLFVRPAARGKGLGKALLARVAQIAIERGCPRMDWMVLDWNEPAIGFYKSLGAIALDKWRVYRLQGEALTRTAGE